MDAIINLSGIKVHVGFWRGERLWHIDRVDCYVVNDSGEFVSQVDVGAVAEWSTKYGHFVSLETIAQEFADAHQTEWDRVAAASARADAIERRNAEQQVA